MAGRTEHREGYESRLVSCKNLQLQTTRLCFSLILLNVFTNNLDEDMIRANFRGSKAREGQMTHRKGSDIPEFRTWSFISEAPVCGGVRHTVSTQNAFTE